MPVLSSFGAASARGFGFGSNRFIYEFIDTTNQATVGTSWDGQENFAYFSFGGGNSSVSKTFSSVTFNGNIGFLNVGSQDNSDGENKTIGMGAINLSTPSTQTVVLNPAPGTVFGQPTYYSNFRILGGYSQPTVFYSDARGGAVWPYTYSIPDCKIGDIVLLGMNYRSSTGTTSSSATNMTVISTPSTTGSVQTYAAYVNTDGTFTTQIDGNEYQQWTQAIAVLRAGT